MVPNFADISEWQPANIDWQAYKAWSSQWDGISRVAIRSSYGVGYKDQHFDAYRAGALAADIDVILMYHYAYPSVNGPQNEANSQHAIVGDIRTSDLLFLDLEENVPQATSEWAYEWLAQQEANYGGKIPGIYASEAYILERLQDVRLGKYALWEAKWQFTPDERPPCPYPWTSYEFVQYTDSAANIPGIAGNVDCNIFLGGSTPMAITIPQGWTDDGTTLTAPDGVQVVLGFRDYVLANNWNANNWPLDHEFAANPVEQSNPGLGAGTAQDFRWTRLEYTAETEVFVAWVGQELVWYQQQNAALQAQVATLQAQVASLQALLSSSNLGKINTIGQQISDDIKLIMQLVQPQ